MDGTEFDKLIEQGKAFGFVGKELYNFVEKERNRLKEERDAERIRYRQHLEYSMEQERENSRLRIQREKERLGLCATQSGPSLAARMSNSATVHAPNKLAQSYHEYVEKLRLKIQSRRREFEAFDVMHKNCKEPVGAKPLRAGQKLCTVEADIRFASGPTELAAESPVVATKATEGRSDGDEALCLESLVDTEMPSVIDLAQPPCMGVAMAANCDVRSTSGPVGEDPCTESGAQSNADAHCELGNVGASSSSRCERRSPEEDACIAQPSVKLPASQGVHKLTENPDCIGIIAEKTSETSSALQMLQVDFSKVSTGQRAKRKRRCTNRRKTKAAKQPGKSRIAKRQSTQRKRRLRFVAFASRGGPYASNRPTDRGVRQAFVRGARKSRPPSLHCPAPRLARQRLSAERHDVVRRPVSIERGDGEGMPPRSPSPGYKLPSQDDLRKKLLPEKVSALKTKILSSLAGAEYVCIALDVWTSRSMEGFLASRSEIRGQRLRASHVIRVVTENVSSMIKPFEFAGWETEKYDEDYSFDDHLERIIKELLSEFHQLEQIRFGCAAHNLQLAAKHSIRQDTSAEEVVRKCGAIVASIRKSTADTEEVFNVAGLHLESQHATSWNSQLRMMRKLVTTLSSPPGLTETLHAYKKGELSKYELRLATDLIELPSLLEEATDLLQKRRETAGLLLPAL
ncbi:hypothetical protein HPB51_004160 [Rhipicephalus microplus]|uniref:Uncharacterized protein n=1 Tax=Rhipicephalus microplus TaxID=6941 RepID=A0A9J6D424_RHIMP|nr:hypothetical protein HPB51_004160 [Rhipicephalus microplus]